MGLYKALEVFKVRRTPPNTPTTTTMFKIN